MNVYLFTQQIDTLQKRLTKLYQNTNTSLQQPDLLLPTVIKELGVSSEKLQIATEELLQQNDELTTLRDHLEAEHQRYRELFNFMPDAYLVTDGQGKILETNRAAATLLGVEQSSLPGKLLVTVIPIEKRPAFRSQLNRLQQCDGVQKCTICLQQRQSGSLEAAVTVAPVRDVSGMLVALRWILRDITAIKRSELLLSTPEYDPCPDHPQHFYFKGDLIPLQPEKLWLVRHGLVKVSTINERGEEVLLGLLGPTMAFGSNLTDLPTYQAIALTPQVELASISCSEITASPKLATAVLPQISQRLRQTEALLAISGRRQAKDRLYHLLLFLKQQFGQPLAQGTRLSIRLTHQDLADACCTTRVTITRLLGKLQQQGYITFDTQNHMIFLCTDEGMRG
ncbi:MAG TPA: transcriptional regulator [Cyanobacteria bacterium UBA8803]|nr:transcriptional regulator [Cyanobacteria bacterium UBA9273]HBL57958.1 transcriptional regulator [Cyanobacteria bacterium UBA8803]